MSAAARRYYAGLHGRWRGPLVLELDAAALAGAAALDRLRLQQWAMVQRIAGPLWLWTALDARDAGSGPAVMHRTAVRKGGVALFRTEERIAFEPAGAVLDGVGHQLGARVAMQGPVTFDEDARGAVYLLPWAGTTMRQSTRIEDGGLRIVQETPWSRAEVLLERYDADGQAPA